MGAEMIRRTIGVAHVADLDGIEDRGQRSLCEFKSLRVGRALLLDAVLGASRSAMRLQRLEDVCHLLTETHTQWSRVGEWTM